MRFFVTLLMLLLPATLSGQSTIEEGLSRRKTAALSEISGFATCPSKPLHPPATVTGTINLSSCVDVIGLREDVYALTVQAGQTIEMTVTSRDFELFVFLYLGNGEAMRVNLDSFLSSSGTSRRTARHTFASSGTYYLEIESLNSYETPTNVPWSGNYTLTVTFAGGTPPPCTGTCLATANTACMLNDRFKVTMTWTDPSAGLSGNGRVITYADARPVTDPVNGEISESTFWSMYAHDQNSLEALVRMLRGNNSFWVFVTGFASAEYTVTIQDTRTCATWQRTTPFGSKEKITDFNAFPFP